jgi:hypothetical protein
MTINTHHIRPPESFQRSNLKENTMEETLDYYESRGIPVPLDIQVKAIGTYGFIIENNYPLEDLMYVERLCRGHNPSGNSYLSPSHAA